MRNSSLFIAVLGLLFFNGPQKLWGESVPPMYARQDNLATHVVSFRDGELTIEAHQVALSEILRAISAKTGAAIDFPPELDRPVDVQIEPGKVIGVLADMFKSLDCDYIIQASFSNPNVPARVILFPKPKSSPPHQQAQAVPPIPSSVPSQAQPVMASDSALAQQAQAVSAPSSTGAEQSGNVAAMEEMGGEIGADPQQILDRWSALHQDMIKQLNARGKR